MSDTPLLEFRNINTHYGAVHILKDVNLAIYPGEMVCLLGGNASGKSTTLKTLLGMVTPTSGEVVLDGEIKIANRLCLNALCGINYQERTLTCSDRARYFVRKINVTGRIDQIQLVFLALVLDSHCNGASFDGDAALPFQLHVIEDLLLHFTLLNGAGIFEQSVG